LKYYGLVVANIPKSNRKQLQVTCSCKQSGYILADFYWCTLMLDDQQVVHAQARVYFEKVKDDLDVAQLGMQESSKFYLKF
jgi:hypothetical protein